jgi:hypothetical protein
MALAGVLSLVVYILAVRSQNGLPAWWFFALMCLISIAAAVGSVLNQRRQRRAVLAVATAIAAALGVITLTSIGGPLILTAALGVVAIATESG